MPRSLWISLGTIPGSKRVIVLGVQEGSREDALAQMRERVKKYFPHQQDRKVISELLVLTKDRPVQLGTQLRAYLRRAGFKEHELDGVTDSFVTLFLKTLSELTEN